MVTMMNLNKYLIELDEYLDLTGLESINEEFMNVVDTIPKKYWSQFYANSSKDGNFLKDSEEVNTLYLTKLQQEWDYLLIDKHEYWADLPIYNKFPKLKNFISNLPFENTGRMFLIFSKNAEEIVTHFDHDLDEWRQEMIWISFNDLKKLFVLKNEKPFYIKGNSCWFNSKKYHGTKTTKTNGYGVSLRVDGEFTSEFRDKLFGKDSKWETAAQWTNDI